MIIDIEPGQVTVRDAADVGLDDQVLDPTAAELVAADLDNRGQTVAGEGMRRAARQARGDR